MVSVFADDPICLHSGDVTVHRGAPGYHQDARSSDTGTAGYD